MTYKVFIAIILFCAMVALVNIITNVIKKLIKPAQVVCLITSVLLSELVTYLYCQYFSYELHWYFFIVAIVCGFAVCYTAMYGYDNLYQQIKEIITNSKKISEEIKENESEE